MFFIKKKAITDTILIRPNRVWPTQEHKKLKIEKYWKRYTQTRNTQGQHEQQQSNTEKTKDSTHSSNQNPTTELTSRNNIDLGAKVAKHPPNNQLRRQSIRPEQLEPTRRLRQSIRQSGTAAKHPPAKWNRRPSATQTMQIERSEGRRRSRKLSEKSRWPPPARLL
jgi:hypothetical protein